MLLLKNKERNATKILTLSLIIIIVSHTLIHVAGSIRTSIFPLIKEEFFLTNVEIGIIAAIPVLSQAVFTIPAGVLSDKLSSQKIITFSISMAVLGAILAGFAQNVLMFIIATSLLTISSTFFHPSANSYISKKMEPEARPKALGLFNSGGIFGFALGSFSITIFMGLMGYKWRNLYQFWILPPLLALIGLYFLPSSPQTNIQNLKESQQENSEDFKLLSNSMIFFLLSSGFRRFGGGMTRAFLSIYLVEIRGWNIGLISLMYGVSRLIGLVAASLGGALTSKIGEKRGVRIALFPAYTCFLVAFFIKGMFTFLILYLAYRFFGMLGSPALSSITARLSPREKRGRGYALSSLPSSIVRTIGPIVAAFIADIFGLLSIFVLSAGVFYMALIIIEFGVKID